MLRTQRVACLILSAALATAFLPGCGNEDSQTEQVGSDATGKARGSGDKSTRPRVVNEVINLEKELCPHSQIWTGGSGEIRFRASCRNRELKEPELGPGAGESAFWVQRYSPSIPQRESGIRAVRAWAHSNGGNRIPTQCRVAGEMGVCRVHSKRPFHLQGVVRIEPQPECGMIVALAILDDQCVLTRKIEACNGVLDIDHLAIKRSPKC
jgi:hypothetical protein